MLKIAKWLTLLAAAAAMTGCVVVPRGYYWGHGHGHGYDDHGGNSRSDDGHRGRGRGGDRWR
jgi:hypothetical protein